jgi:hypothetical protein
VFERYLAMAREVQTGGDRVAAENLFQHAEHYFRIMNAQGEGQNQGQPRPTTPADNEMGGGDGQPRESEEAFVQTTQPPSLRPVSDAEFRDELDQSIAAADRKSGAGEDEEQPPGF